MLSSESTASQRFGPVLRRLVAWIEEFTLASHVDDRSTFVMNVHDVFLFEDGRSVFAGDVVHGPAFISSVKCELVVEGVPIGRFDIEGEMIPVPRSSKMRAVSTMAQVDVDLVRRSLDQCQLRRLR